MWDPKPLVFSDFTLHRDLAISALLVNISVRATEPSVYCFMLHIADAKICPDRLKLFQYSTQIGHYKNYIDVKRRTHNEQERAGPLKDYCTIPCFPRKHLFLGESDV